MFLPPPSLPKYKILWNRVQKSKNNFLPFSSFLYKAIFNFTNKSHFLVEKKFSKKRVNGYNNNKREYHVLVAGTTHYKII